jgi:hypothetical protein
VLIVADKQILCAKCGALVGLSKEFTERTRVWSQLMLKDRAVVSGDDWEFFCNIKCKERAQV